jgi:hypothetical protein
MASIGLFEDEFNDKLTNMKKIIKSKHGTVTIDMPESFQPNEEDMRGAVEFMDRMGHAGKASVSRVDYKDEDGNDMGSIVWTPDQDEVKVE